MTHLNLFRLFPNSPTILVSPAFFSLSGFCPAQYFNIFPQVCDSINGTTYSYHVSGTAVFPATGEFHAEVITNTPTPEVLFSGVQAMRRPELFLSIPERFLHGIFTCISGSYWTMPLSMNFTISNNLC